DQRRIGEQRFVIGVAYDDRVRGDLEGLGVEGYARSEEHTSELQSLAYLVCRLLLEKKKTNASRTPTAVARTTSSTSAAMDTLLTQICPGTRVSRSRRSPTHPPTS